MKVCRFQTAHHGPRLGILQDEDIIDLALAGIDHLSDLLELAAPATRLAELARRGLPRVACTQAQLLQPIDRQEVWAAGVTYSRSKSARMEESNFSANAYDRVYDAPRPEIFFKSLPEKVISPGDAVGIRRDAKWNVPEPELALVLNSRGEVAGYTIGNDMSSRDIEGENLLYLPQAKTYHRSCAVGPCIVFGATEAEARDWTVGVSIDRAGVNVFTGETSVGRIKRTFGELAEWLFRCQRFPHGALLLTGTGVVPPNEFTLEDGDQIRIDISGIGTLSNPVIRV